MKILIPDDAVSHLIATEDLSKIALKNGKNLKPKLRYNTDTCKGLSRFIKY